MSAPLIVLKFGGSVLRAPDSLNPCGHEIYRWRRAGYRIVVVVSAFHGRTDQLLERGQAWQLDDNPWDLAEWLAQGELESAEALHDHLARVGVDSQVLTPGDLSLLARGPALDATPVVLDRKPIDACHGNDQVVIVPGFHAHNRERRTVLLGRGGSDLSALFLAKALKADGCRLVKDVDGLYDRDPALGEPGTRRFAYAHWSTALETDGAVLQHAAVRFAQGAKLSFQIGALQSVQPTTIGPGSTRVASRAAPAAPLRAVLLGFGTVGQGVAACLNDPAFPIELVAIGVRRPQRHAQAHPPDVPVFASLQEALQVPADVVIELIGGIEPAYGVVRSALQQGKHVVTANKALLARHGPALRALAAQRRVRLCDSASVGGSMPLLEWLRRENAEAGLRLEGCLNGTSQWLAHAGSAGEPWEAALRSAIEQGYAEADPTRDVSGQDSADKLCVIAQALGWEPKSPDSIPRAPMCADWFEPGQPLRAVARLDGSAQHWSAAVEARWLPENHPLAQLPGPWNGCLVTPTGREARFVKGLGAGRWPTTESVIGDLLQIAREGVPAPATSVAPAVV